jgi:glycosyltransferase involved in cell wall biosynthesis
VNLPRVLLMTTYYVPVMGGVETHARGLAGYLSRAGFQIHVVTKRVAREHPVNEIVDGVAVHRVPPTGARSGRGKWLTTPFMLQYALGERPASDVIVCIDYRGIGLAAVAAGRLTGRAVIVQAETAGVMASAAVDGSDRSGVPPEAPLTKAIKAPIRAVYRQADHVVCIGRDLEQETLDAGVPRDRVHYIPHGVDLTRFHAPAGQERASIRAAEGLPLDRPIVLSVGRLSTEKGVLDLLEAWRLVADPRALLLLVGPDMPGHQWDAGPAVRAFITAHTLHDRVRVYGPSTDPSRLYRAADLFVQPSHFEAFGISVIEAMATGVPVVASAVGGLRDFLVDGSNALLHPPRTPAALAAALRRALADSALRATLAAEALRTVQQFDEQSLFGVYGDLIVRAAREKRRA